MVNAVAVSSSPTHVRFPAELNAAVDAFARRSGRPRSTVVVLAVDEWLREQAHPGIHFTSDLAGRRRARLRGGPDVWTVAESWLAHDAADRSTEAVAEATGLAVEQIEAALAYWADHRREIDSQLAEHQDAQQTAYESWERRRRLDEL